jgi:hypothetical protein
MHPTITDIIAKIKAEKEELGITLYAPASSTEILDFENSMGIKLSEDIAEFYRFCNGFESEEDMFRIIPLDEIIDNIEQPDTYAVELNDFHFAEYLIYSDMWTISVNPVDRNDYHIYNKAENVIILTNSFVEFLNTFLIGGVFNGLYTWRKNIERLPK